MVLDDVNPSPKATSVDCTRRGAINESHTDVGGWCWMMWARDGMGAEGRAARRVRTHRRAIAVVWEYNPV